MKLFLDSADINEIRSCFELGGLDGITTTPTFFERLKIRNVNEAIREITREINGEVHVEALGNGIAETIDAARRNRDLGLNIVSKIPISEVGLEAAQRLEEEGIRTNLHLIFSVGQAVLAARAGVSYICPLMGRLTDFGLNGATIVSDVVEVIEGQRGLKSTVMVSSIRNPEQFRTAIASGATAITVPGRVLQRIMGRSCG